MHGKKYLLIVALMVALVALVGLSADVAQARGINKFAPTHPPTCVKVLSTDYVGDYYELQCTDTGKDIVSVQVLTTSDVKYTLDWDASSVMLRVYPDPKADRVRLSWFVTDKAGAKLAGTLP